MTEPMSDDELRRINEEIEGVARALFSALDNTAITVSDLSWEETDDEAAKDDMRRLAAVAIDARDAQVRRRMQRPTRVLLLEAPIEGDLAETPIDQLISRQVVQGSLTLLADADEAFVFRGDKAVALKHRDRGRGDVHVAIQRRQT